MSALTDSPGPSANTVQPGSPGASLCARSKLVQPPTRSKAVSFGTLAHSVFLYKPIVFPTKAGCGTSVCKNACKAWLVVVNISEWASDVEAT